MSLERLLQLLHASNKIAFALVFVGAVLLLGKAFGFLPFQVPEVATGWLMIASLLGAGMMIASFVAWLGSLIAEGAAAKQDQCPRGQ